MLTVADKIEVAVYPFLEGDELVIHIAVGDKDLDPVSLPISRLIDEYIEFNSEMFQNCISSANAPEAKRLVGILRLAARTLETAIA